jgi:hypothetical protein
VTADAKAVIGQRQHTQGQRQKDLAFMEIHRFESS